MFWIWPITAILDQFLLLWIICPIWSSLIHFEDTWNEKMSSELDQLLQLQRLNLFCNNLAGTKNLLDAWLKSPKFLLLSNNLFIDGTWRKFRFLMEHDLISFHSSSLEGPLPKSLLILASCSIICFPSEKV